MANFNLASLSPSMLHKILSKVATTSIRDFGCARVAFPGFNAIGREDYFYKSADLIFLNDCLDQVNAVRTFRLKCYQLGNPEAIYLQDGMMNLAFSVDHRGLFHNYPDFTREYADHPNVCYDCWCSAIIEPVFVVSIDGSRTRWKCDPWDLCNEIQLTARDWPIGD
ncbi:hypothetical protein IGI04_025953 [Brassica rapa subsp. trilocularis]|uniref:F-box associated domain-containing protein n=1 Tax=Brassica rapa subsp. trilocularis TaxID=1813537 RepID=A0ABQ7KYI9_BRACM|nr:hypothetical protein IGI04_025953 [Brassica rapa subsp. trilocularis]